MNRRTNIVSLDDNLINCIKVCLSNVSSFSNIARNLSDNEIRKEIKKEDDESKKQTIATRNNFEIIINSIITLLGDDKFKIEKTTSPKQCPFCQNIIYSTFNLKYIKVNLDYYLGETFSLEEFCRPIKGENPCRKCKKTINVEYNFTFLPEILIIILGSKSYNKVFEYKYKTILNYTKKNNSNNNSEYVLKSLIGQIDELRFKPFLFNNEIDFNNNYKQNEDIFSCPTILFYEGPKTSHNEDDEYLQNDYLGYMPQQPNNNNLNNNNIITIYFNFIKNNKKIYLDINKNEKFNKAIDELKEKYNWLKNMRNLKFTFNDRIVNNYKTLTENGIVDGSEIIINQ